MPTRNRVLEDFDPTKSDPEDEDYDATASRSRATRVTKHRRSKPTRKRKRATREDSLSEGISESEALSDDSFDNEDQEPPETDPRTGRPVRKASKKQPQYLESDGDSVDFANRMDSSGSDEEPVKKKLKSSPRKSLIVKLKTRGPADGSMRRSTRPASGSVGSRHAPLAEAAGMTRRSSRIAHDGTEGLYALTNSGNHVEVTRAPTKSPETFPPRASKGAKGIKKPPSAIFEEATPTKEEPEEDERHYEAETEVVASGEEHAGAEGDSLSTNSNTVDAAQQTALEQERNGDADLAESAIVPESNDEDDEDVAVVPRRSNRIREDSDDRDKDTLEAAATEGPNKQPSRKNLRSGALSRDTRSTQRGRKRGIDDTSDFEPGADDAAEDEMSSSSESAGSPQKGSQERDDSSTNARRSKRIKTSGRIANSAERDSEEELLEELEELRERKPRRSAKAMTTLDDRPQTRKRKPVDYRILRPDLNINIEEDGPPPAATPSRRGRGGGTSAWQRSLFSIEGPFGGAGGPPPVLGGPGGAGATGGVDSDSSDDETVLRQRPPGVGGTVGMTPTTAAPPGFGLFPAAQTHSADALQASLGKVKDKQALADSDPLGVDPNVNFDGVGGLDGHIDQLKEMVALPLLYPEIFQRFHITPPRGVLFHGPPGTGKTLLARALASSVSSAGRKVTFYMRKGADALSKWVGEAERQLRLLFEEARKTQPSIIFFDEIDGMSISLASPGP